MTRRAEKEIMEATYSLHSMSLEAAEKVYNDKTMLKLFSINENWHPNIKWGWEHNKADL